MVFPDMIVYCVVNESEMANPHNVELEAAKFLHKLIQDSKDEPTKLATKLYVVCTLFLGIVSMFFMFLIWEYFLNVKLLLVWDFRYCNT